MGHSCIGCGFYYLWRLFDWERGVKGLNRATIIGTLGRDPEVKYTTGGSAICNISMATSEKWKDKESNEYKERTEWHRVVFFGKLAETAGQYLKKGSKACVTGKIQTRKWQGQDGQDKYTTEIIGSDLVFLDSKGDTPSAHTNTPVGNTEPPARSESVGGDFGDDIPFASVDWRTV